METGNADVQERNSTTGWVALHEASFRGNIESVKCLLQLNAPLRPRTPAPDEDTPRELAVRYKQQTVVELLGKTNKEIISISPLSLYSSPFCIL